MSLFGCVIGISCYYILIFKTHVKTMKEHQMKKGLQMDKMQEHEKLEVCTPKQYQARTITMVDIIFWSVGFVLQ